MARGSICRIWCAARCFLAGQAVLVVRDGQQFYITPENFPTLRTEFGDAVNLVGLKRLLSAGG
jgi:hypothetical protein